MSEIENISKGLGTGYKDRKTGLICMIRCFKCGAENWALAVASGTCSFCGFDANKEGAENESLHSSL